MTSLDDVLAGVPSLNDESEPFSYAVDGERIVGTWDIVKATSLYPGSISHVDKDYRLIVTLDAESQEFDYEDSISTRRAGVDHGGAHASVEGSRGKMVKKEFHLEFGGINKTDEGTGMQPVAYSFETSRIKEPLFAYLGQHGMHRKKGLISKLFGH